MRQLGSAAPHPGGQQVGLPAVVEELLVEVVADGFALYCCGPKAAPTALVACYEWQDCVDLFTVRDFERVITARVLKRGRRVDIFAPEVVAWAYEGPPQHAVRALLDLVHPGHPDAPTVGYPAPAGLHVPRAQQRPMTIQPPTPGRAGVRAARLTTAMRTHGGGNLPEQQKIAGWPPVEPATPGARLLAASRSPAPLPITRCTMPAQAPRSAQDRWCDVNGVPIGLFCQVEQVEDSAERTALPSWRHQRGQVVGWDTDLVYVCFSGNHVISLRPCLLRVLDEAPGGG